MSFFENTYHLRQIGFDSLYLDTYNAHISMAMFAVTPFLEH